MSDFFLHFDRSSKINPFSIYKIELHNYSALFFYKYILFRGPFFFDLFFDFFCSLSWQLPTNSIVIQQNSTLYEDIYTLLSLFFFFLVLKPLSLFFTLSFLFFFPFFF